MLELDGWVVLNFNTSFLLILLLVFQVRTSRMAAGRKYSAILVLTLVLMLSESIGRIGETYPERYLVLAYLGYFIIFLFDPLDILFAVNYVDCWMDSGNQKSRAVFRGAFWTFAIANVVAVLLDAILRAKWFFYFEDNVYHRGSLFMVRAILMMLFIVLLLIYTLVFRKDILSEYKNTILFLPLFSLCGALLQVFISNIDTTYAGISLGCLVIFFFFQSKDVNMDYLTGVLNRRGLDIKVQERVKNSISSGKNFSAIMMDIDNFKLINDQMGHAAGDKAIKGIASALVDIFGDDATIGRFGGDEFCILSDIVTKIEIKERIAEVRDEIELLKRKNGWPDSVGISCGYHIYDHKDQLSVKRLQEIIDEKMYTEKQKHHSGQ